MQSLYAWDCTGLPQTRPDVVDIINHHTKIDDAISLSAPKWPLEKINKIDLAILRCAIWEINNHPEVPVKVVIDEAIEMAKEFGTDTSSSFVNGVLGSIINKDEPTQS